jgi:hypothetical protein
MMPSAQQVTMKPKIAFSIESIVGTKLDVDEYSQLLKRAKNLSPADNLEFGKGRIRTNSELSEHEYQRNNNNDSDSVNKNNQDDSDRKSVTRSPTPVKQQQQQQQQPVIVPGIPAGLIRPIASHNAQLPPHFADAAAHPHFLAQFQAAAALANVHAAQSGFPHQHLPPHLHNPANMHRESYPLYPWLLSRHGRIFPHRFPGSEYQT